MLNSLIPIISDLDFQNIQLKMSLPRNPPGHGTSNPEAGNGWHQKAIFIPDLLLVQEITSHFLNSLK